MRSTLNPIGDPRMLEIQVALVNALDALDRPGEARTLCEAIEPFLKSSASPCVANLRQRLNSPDSNRRNATAMRRGPHC
ncbi:MAG: hypothetical protein ABIW82_15915 [Dokdonella sp.]